MSAVTGLDVDGGCDGPSRDGGGNQWDARPKGRTSRTALYSIYLQDVISGPELLLAANDMTGEVHLGFCN